MGLNILIAEDEVQLSKVYTMALRREGHTVDQAFNGEKAVQMVRDKAYDVLLCDVMMPQKNGLEAVREIRESGEKIHIVMLTALSEVDDKIIGLENGADDYLTKPISLKELIARLSSIERRVSQLDRLTLSLGNTTLKHEALELSASNAIRLSSKESQMLFYFMSNPNKSFTTQQLFAYVWGEDNDDEVDEGYVYIYVSYLRRKLHSIGSTLVIDATDDTYQLTVQ
ncbi:response regulator transcription factor [Carnobacteriaceae bacterium zg-ZUI252]|nr:response regulator transcription factor [Carnobacteriaceae bacterium zg-ZUI252]MBS4770348.1 response regulator transcription factor [Carnobacteriaceae bacterium zg-ZUI240]